MKTEALFGGRRHSLVVRLMPQMAAGCAAVQTGTWVSASLVMLRDAGAVSACLDECTPAHLLS